MLRQRIKELDELADVENRMISNGINRKFEQLNFQDRISELYKPITNKIDEQIKSNNDNVLKILESNKLALEGSKNLAIDEYKENHPLIISNNSNSSKQNNATFHKLTDNGEFQTFAVNNSKKEVSINLNKSTGQMNVISKNGEIIPIKRTDGLIKLLFDTSDEPNLDNVTNDDYNEWKNIYNAIGTNIGSSKKAEVIDKKFNPNHNPDKYKSKRTKTKTSIPTILSDREPQFLPQDIIDNFNQSRTGSGLKELLITIPSTVEEIVKRVTVLKAAYNAGHSNVKQELTSLLDNLLTRKIITKEKYLDFLSKNDN